MTGFLHAIAQKLKALPVPINYHDISAVFLSTAPNIENNSKAYEQEDIHAQLVVLKQLASQCIVFEQSIKSQQEYIELRRQYPTRIEELNVELSKIQAQDAEQRKEAYELYVQAISAINECVSAPSQKLATLNEQCTFNDLKSSIEANKRAIALQLYNTDSALIYLLIKKQTLLIAQINALGFDYSLNNSISFLQAGLSQLSLQIKQYKAQLPNLKTLLQEFSDSLTIADIQPHLERLQSNIEQSSRKIAQFQLSMQKAPLTAEKKKTLEESKDKQSLIDTYEAQLQEQFTSWKTAEAWSNWAFGANDTAKLEIEECVAYLRHLLAIKVEEQSITPDKIFAEQLNTLVSRTSTPISTDAQKLQLISRAIDCFNELSITGLPSNSTVVDYFRRLIQEEVNIPNLEEQIDIKERCALLLEQLIKALTVSQNLADEHRKLANGPLRGHVAPSAAQLSTREEPMDVEDTLQERKKAQSQQLTHCFNYMKRINAIEETLKGYGVKKQEISVNLKSLKTELSKETDSALEQEKQKTSDTLTLLQQDIVLKHTKILEMLEAKRLEEEQRAIQEIAREKSLETIQRPPLDLLVFEMLQGNNSIDTSIIEPNSEDKKEVVIQPPLTAHASEEQAVTVDNQVTTQTSVTANEAIRALLPGPLIKVPVDVGPPKLLVIDDLMHEQSAENLDKEPDLGSPIITPDGPILTDDKDIIIDNVDENEINTSEPVVENSANQQQTTQEPQPPQPPLSKNPCLLWHKKMQTYLKKQLSPLCSWYQAIYDKVDSEHQNNQYTHLIRDIAFATKHNDIETLKAYKRLCPKPHESIEPLLALKPKIPVSDMKEVDLLNALPPELQMLKTQHERLKSKYPREASLLLDLIGIVYYAHKNKAENYAFVKGLPCVLDDPRYFSLKKHRGMLCVWQAIEDFFRKLINEILDRPNVCKPCFFKTRSVRLVEEGILLQQSEAISIGPI